MATLAELARSHTDLDGPQLAHVQRLVASWGLLADLCFADLLLFLPITRDEEPTGSESGRFVIVGQIRPTTSQTIYRQDLVGVVADEVERPLVVRASRLGEMVEGEINVGSSQERVRVLAVPARWEGEVIGVMSRESPPTMARQPGELERTYNEIFLRFAKMIAAGDFPFAAEDAESEEAPRVGDGVILLDEHGDVEYASPNAVSALHRLGIHANVEGTRLADVGFEETGIRTALATGVPVTEEIERGPEVTILLRCLPLTDHGTVDGALLLMRDISELRRRDRLLISMDATIREIHHRVKNNLQTISSLLRLQGRRMASEEAKFAIEESVRRIGSIALVHETLSRGAGDDVPFSEILRPLVRMVEEGLVSPEHPVRFRIIGDAGKLPASVATPLAVVLTESLQNAVQHAFGHDAQPDGSEGRVEVILDNDGATLNVRVIDDGKGLLPDFAIDRATGLGLSIVRTLVTGELGGTIAMGPRRDGAPGTEVEISVPVHVAHHTER